MRSEARIQRSEFLAYQQSLICYDGIQLFVGTGARKRLFICLAIPSNSGELFLCSPISRLMLENYIYQKIDLYALILSNNTERFFLVDLTQPTPKGYLLQPVQKLCSDWLPERQIFANCHTEIYNFEDSSISSLLPSSREIGIDGRWDAQDLANFPELFLDSYSFHYALTTQRSEQNSSRVKELFRKYPWRGGFSTVQFYNGLYDAIPRKNKLNIQGITYNSPGTIKLSVVPQIFEKIHKGTDEFTTNRKAALTAFKELREGLSKRELLGKSVAEMNADDSDYSFAQRKSTELAKLIGFDEIQDVFLLAERNWISTAKIMMSYFRRLKALVDFFGTGKAHFVD